MAYVNFKNSPSEETPLTGGATGNLNVMQENGTSHGSDTKLGYSQAFLNEHIVNVSNEVDEDYRVNFLKNQKNLLNLAVKNCTITNTGEEYTAVAPETRLCFDYIPLEASTEIVFSCNVNTVFMGIAYYDANKTFISRIANNDQSAISGTTPANTKYVRPFVQVNEDVSLSVNSVNQYEMQLELGNTRTTFEEVITPSIYVDNEEIYSKSEILFNQEAASATTNLTLSNDYTNYRYLEIYGRSNNNGRFYKKVDTSYTNFTIDISTPITGSLIIQEYVNLYSMSGNTITCTRYLRNNCTNGSANVVSETNGIYIDKVIGYK